VQAFFCVIALTDWLQWGYLIVSGSLAADSLMKYDAMIRASKDGKELAGKRFDDGRFVALLD
jgi:hypothetical protein